jgi:hypothetical protein
MNNMFTKFVITKAIQILIMIVCGFQFEITRAQWSTNPYLNTPVCTAENTQAKSVSVSDGHGGVIIAWYDARNPQDENIYAQHIDSSGNAKWALNGISICAATSLQAQVAIISDGSGGAIIAWADFRNGNDIDIYAQRVNGNGVVQWTTDGVGICTAPGDQTYPVLTTDGNGGAIFTWTDERTFNPSIIPHIYVQGINSNGTLKWAEAAICTAIEGQTQPAIVSDSSGGAFIVWKDARNWRDGTSGSDIYAQHIGSNGLIQWIVDGVSICKATRDQDYPKLTSDGSGGAIITWQDHRDENNSYPLNADIYAQRVNANGLVQWASNGIAICNDMDKQLFEQITSDESGGAIISWVSWSGVGTSATSKISLQRVNSNGTALWQNNGIPIGSGDNQNPVIASDGVGGAFLVFEAKITSGNEIYAQHIGSDGLELWKPFGGLVVTNA